MYRRNSWADTVDDAGYYRGVRIKRAAVGGKNTSVCESALLLSPRGPSLELLRGRRSSDTEKHRGRQRGTLSCEARRGATGCGHEVSLDAG